MIIQVFVISIVVAFARSHLTPWQGPKQLHPVHGLYVKPSVDGTTGDLYVAATEDSGTTTQWLTDQPINFLPVGGATQQATTAPYTSISSASGHEESQSTQKRAVITSPPVHYTYALPVSGSTDTGVLPYPYAIPAASTQTSTSSETSSIPQCTDATAAVPYSPFQYFYPHMLSAYANAKAILKDSGMSDDKAGTIVSQASPMWAPYSGYPMYVMVDPSAWAQAQAAQATAATSTSSKES